ncbi:MAG: alpha/beta hydrolase-fold protein [Planctomycetota bacterium]|nr:alpha/beta hydrolase-fold protein [Planctomycetota bacterium]
MRLLPILLLPPFAAADTITVDAGRGPITVHVPDSYSDGTPAPLVVLLHGYSGNGPGQESYMKFLAVHEEYGFHYAYPNGTIDQFGNRFWNATDACCDFGPTGVDDSAYLAALLDAIEAAVDVDPRRVYFIGHSNGGFMSYRMACDHSDRVAAICSLAGAAWKNPGDCNATSPVNVLQIHGTQDGTIAYGGGLINGAPYPGAMESCEQWATYAGCDLTPVPGDPLNLDKSLPGKETTVLRWEANCDDRGSAELWSIVGGGHGPNLSDPFAGNVIKWLYAHPQPGVDVIRYCTPNEVNSTGGSAVLAASGSDSVAQNNFTLTASSLPANEFGYLLASLDQGFVMPPGSSGNLCVSGDVARLVDQLQSSGAGGSFSATISLKQLPTNPPQNVLTGQSWNFQAWYRDGTTSNFTDAITVLFR